MVPNKYEPLTRHLDGLRDAEISMSFRDIESVIGAKLPDSARRHRAWWANNGTNNVAVEAWRRAKRKTARVDMAHERVVFVLEGDVWSGSPGEAGGAPTVDSRLISLEVAKLSSIVRAALERDGEDDAAVIRLLEDGAIERRRRLLDRLAQGPATADSSVDLIREDRDAR